METQQTYAQMLGMADRTTPEMNPVQPGMDSIMDPNAAAPLAAMHRPVQSPAELEARKTGWAQVAEKLSDPNLLRAFGFASAAMMQPGANLGHGLASGLTAFQAGEYAQRQQGVQERQLTMKEAESAAGVEQTKATTDLRKAQIPGAAAESRVAEETAQAKIDAAKIAAEKATIELGTVKDEASVKKIENELKRRKTELESSVPDSVLRKAIFAEYDKLLAQAAEQRAKAGKTETEKRIKDRELKLIEGMSDDELRQFLSKSGKFSATQSAIVQQADLWGRLYDGISKDKPDDPHVKGKTREQFVRDRLTEAKQKDARELLIKAIQVGMEKEDIEALGLWEAALKVSGSPAAEPKEKGKETPWKPMGKDREFRVLEDGTTQVRRKAVASPEFSGDSNMP